MPHALIEMYTDIVSRTTVQSQSKRLPNASKARHLTCVVPNSSGLDR